MDDSHKYSARLKPKDAYQANQLTFIGLDGRAIYEYAKDDTITPEYGKLPDCGPALYYSARNVSQFLLVASLRKMYMDIKYTKRIMALALKTPNAFSIMDTSLHYTLLDGRIGYFTSRQVPMDVWGYPDNHSTIPRLLDQSVATLRKHANFVLDINLGKQHIFAGVQLGLAVQPHNDSPASPERSVAEQGL